MFVARWQIDSRFGQKSATIELMRQWEREIGSQVGLDKMKFQLLTGSIGAREATLETDHQVESLAELEEFFAKIGKLEAHQAWGKAMEPLVVSGSSKWEIFRVL